MSADLARAELARRVRLQVQQGRDATVSLLRELVRRDSPSHREGRASDPRSTVGHLAAAIADSGMELHSQAHSPESESIMQVLPGPGGRDAEGGQDADGSARRTLLFVAHTDVVSAGDHAAWIGQDPFSAEIGTAEYLGAGRIALDVSGERHEAVLRERMAAVWEARAERRRTIVYGRGSFDDKGAVAAAAGALSALARACREAGVSLGGDLVAAYTTDEELDATGIRRFGIGAESWLGARDLLGGRRDRDGMTLDLHAVVLEGSYGWAPVIGHRGGMHVLLTVRGRASHASTPALGVNAVAAMAEIITRLGVEEEQVRSRLEPRMDASLLGPLTLAPGTTIVGGGIRRVDRGPAGISVDRADLNVIPEWCEATIDVRFPPLTSTAAGDDPAGVIIAAIEAWIGEAFADEPWEVSLSLVPGTYMPAVALGRTIAEASDLAIVRSARGAAEDVLGHDPGMAIAPGGSDATYLINEAGISSLVEFGPAGGLSHDTHEFVDLDDVIAGAEILALLAIDHLGVVE